MTKYRQLGSDKSGPMWSYLFEKDEIIVMINGTTLSVVRDADWMSALEDVGISVEDQIQKMVQ